MQAPIDTKPRWERRKDARPQELLAAALDLFVERGFASTRLEDVAKRAGVSKGTLYLYFENKQELFKAVVRDNMVQSIGEAENSMAASEESSADLLRKVMMQWWEEFGATKLAGLTKLMMAEANNFPELAQFYNEEVVTRGNALIVSLLERGMQRGEFRQVDPVLVSTILSAPVTMLMMWTHSYLPCEVKNIDPLAYMDAFIDMSVRSLQVEGPGKS